MTTYAQHVAGEQLLFLFGNGGSPETFAASCSINTQRKVEFKASMYTNEVASCDTPSAPSKTVRRVKALDVTFTGAGTADLASFQTLYNLWVAGAAFDGEVMQNVNGANGWTLAGSFMIESLSLTGTTHEDQTFDISISQADILTMTFGTP